MRNHWLRAVVVAATLMCARSVVAESEHPEVITFSLRGEVYRLTVPAGFCTTSGADDEIAQAIAAQDVRNMTHVAFIPRETVGREEAFTRWGMLKTPYDSLGKIVPTRQAWLSELKEDVDFGVFNGVFDNPGALVDRSYRDIFGEEAELGGHMEMVEADAYAGYVLGTLLVDLGNRQEPVAGAGALTMVRGNVFFYYRYQPYEDPSDLAELLQQVKIDIREFVEDNEG